MRVAVCPSDRQGVGWYRLGLPAMTLADAGESIDFSFLPGLPLNVDSENRPVSVADDFDCDVLVLQRPMADWQLLAIRDLQARGVGIVVELDDDFHAIDKRNAFALNLRQQHLDAVVEACNLADLVTVSTPALARRYAPHGRVAVLPNYVSAKWLDIDGHADDPRCETACPCDTCAAFPRPRVVGWTGTVANHMPDLQATSGGVGVAVDAHDARFRVIGRGDRVARNLGLNAEPEVVPWQRMEQYPHEIAKLDVGIAPLADTAFNRAKSWLKPLEMAAVGVPCVMSPSDEYRRLNREHGIGVLARNGSRNVWAREVGRLLADDVCRSELAALGREAVRESLTIEDNCHKWAEAWASVAKGAVCA